MIARHMKRDYNLLFLSSFLMSGGYYKEKYGAARHNKERRIKEREGCTFLSSSNGLVGYYLLLPTKPMRREERQTNLFFYIPPSITNSRWRNKEKVGRTRLFFSLSSSINNVWRITHQLISAMTLFEEEEKKDWSDLLFKMAWGGNK